MKAVIQRVKNASVKVDGLVVGAIDTGLLIYFGVDAADDKSMCTRFVEKIKKMRIFEDENGKMNKSVLDLSYSVLIVSQFTLSANVYSGNRPSFDTAASPDTANSIYEDFVSEFKATGLKIETGVFGAHMEVEYLNDGPVTFILDSDKLIRK